MLHSRGYFPQAQSYKNPEVDKLTQRARREQDTSKRLDLYAKIVSLAAKDLHQIYTFLPRHFTASRSWVHGLNQDQNVNNLSLNNFPYFYAISKH